MGKIKPLKGRCANNFCTTNCFQNYRLCRKHLAEKNKAIKRKEMVSTDGR